ncbi:GNAT family N-acetyltransferase [Murimonas intestini]|uniref:Acetyltransferase (GNAT) family protein n=2 Tax=Murimonas intestini TaxID=1337051 RepID=A0AB73TAD1_9FIRM|nr:GNAT family N-acetyltransferase [Murimonas intestini]MCR1839095.1 GNAT family N-acetyltransferase [Murimonas intestini]MCR1864391.1 GNAT family N-acetyltransferase [Murimonas intestini]MCR1882001.1 GNAT family N-acetyltransferase [Murimonas intestini]
MDIRDMVRERTEDYAEIYVSVFNGAPWNESWTKEKAVRRIQDMMETNTFSGLALMDGEEVCGMIWGQKEQFYNGIHFQIQEFCIRSGCQGKGYGPRLLQAFTDRLKELGVTRIYLLTCPGKRTEGFYLSQGFHRSGSTIIMSCSN